MATTSYGVNDALAVKLWSKKLMAEVLKAPWASRFFGRTSGSLIQIKDETSKSAGDKITFGLRMQLSGGGVQGDGSLEGNEESLTTYSDSLLIDQLRHAVRAAGRMSQQRVPFSVRQEAMDGLKDWWADRIDASFFNHACGNTAQTDTRYTGNQATVAPSSGNIVRAGAVANDQSLGSTNVFDLTLIDKAVEKAKTLSPAIRPVKVGGKDYFVAFLHPYQVTSLRTNTSDGQWQDIQKAAMAGGVTKDNPIFDGSLGVYNGTILHESTRVTLGCDSSTATTAVANTRRAVLCGAQAAVVGFGRENGPNNFTWVEELFDYENQLGVAAGTIFGLKKTIFNSADFATVVMSTYAAAAS